MEIYNLEDISTTSCPKCDLGSYYSFTYKPKSFPAWIAPLTINDYQIIDNYEFDILIVRCDMCGYERVCYCKDYDPVKEGEKAKEQAERAARIRAEQIKTAKGLAL